MNNIGKLNLLSYNRLKENWNIIKDIILDEFQFNNSSYKLGDISKSLFSGHYYVFIISLLDIHLLRNNHNYFDDYLGNGNEVEDNYKNYLIVIYHIY